MTEFEKNCTLLIHRNEQTLSATASAASAFANGALSLMGAASVQSQQLPSASDIQKRLEDPKDSVKAQALKQLILMTIQPAGEAGGWSGFGTSSGAYVPSKLMTVIRFVLNSSDHTVKKLLLLYWEIVDKCNADGSLKDEMILVCNALRNDLMHPNEYVCGATLRSLCKLRYRKLLEPLTEAIMKNLTHRHSYVRRNAVMCVHAAVRAFGPEFMPHALNEVEQLLYNESDLSAKRNALLMLAHCDVERALKYVKSVRDSATCLGDTVQLQLLQLIKNVCDSDPSKKMELLPIVVDLISGCAPAVAYAGADVLVSLTTVPAALKAALKAYIQLLTGHADNNVKLIVLDRISSIVNEFKSATEEFAIDILRALQCPSPEVRQKSLDIALCLVSPKNVSDVVATLRRELAKSNQLEGKLSSGNAAYQRILIHALRVASSGHPNVAETVVPLLLDFLSDSSPNTAGEVILFVREVVATYPSLRPTVLTRLLEELPDVPTGRVLRVCVWLLGEFADEGHVSPRAFVEKIYEALEPYPLIAEEGNETAEGPQKNREGADARQGELGAGPGTSAAAVKASNDVVSTAAKDKVAVKVSTRTVVLPDGTYGTQDVYETVVGGDEEQSGQLGPGAGQKSTQLRSRVVVTGDFLLPAALSLALTKVVMSEEGSKLTAPVKARALFIVAALYKFVRSHTACGPTSDSAIRINQCLRILIKEAVQRNDASRLSSRILPHGRAALLKVLEAERSAVEFELLGEKAMSTGGRNTGLKSSAGTVGARNPGLAPFLGQKEPTVAVVEPYRTIAFSQLKNPALAARQAKRAHESEGSEAGSLFAESGIAKQDDSVVFQQRLEKVQQMSGLADPVYVEAFLQVNQFDLLVELKLTNRTDQTLQNVHVELCTHGDLKLVERPQAVTLTPGQTKVTYASIRVQSTETGIIFGHFTYDRRSAADKETVVLNELQVDLLEYIKRSWASDLSFRLMWSEFEWENKIAINVPILDVHSFLELVLRRTNMTIVGRYLQLGESDQGKPSKTRRWKELLKRSLPRSDADPQEDETEDYLRSAVNNPYLRKLMVTSSFFSINLYSRSIFGEDALANLSVEKVQNKLVGSVRIRSRTQGIALSLGDRFSMVQREALQLFGLPVTSKAGAQKSDPSVLVAA